MSAGSFEAFADWWDQQVGDDGDFFHQHLIRPALLRVLGDVGGLSVLDLGCGNGASSRPLVRRDAQVTGVDVSPTLVKHARAREVATPLGIRYLVADAASIPLLDESFDRVITNMALMDIEDAAGALREVGRLLKPGGRFAASLIHPCFHIEGGSSWLTEEVDLSPARISRRVWRYRDVFSAPGYAKPGQPIAQQYYHRPLSWYATQLREAGLLIDTLDEPLPDEEFYRQRPDGWSRQAIVPFILVIGAWKVG